MILSPESYFSELCAQLDWTFLEVQASLEQVLELARETRAASADEEATFLALGEDAQIAFRLADEQGVPTRVENFAVLEGAARYYVGTLFIVSSSNVFPPALQQLAKYTAENWFEGTRVGIGHCLLRASSTKIYHKVDFFFPLTNSFGA